jgi:hypothetical protein
MSDTANMFLIYPGMTDFEEVKIIEPAREAGYCYVRPLGSDDEIKVSMTRLVDRETAITRKNTKIIQRDGYTVTETTIRGI